MSDRIATSHECLIWVEQNPKFKFKSAQLYFCTRGMDRQAFTKHYGTGLPVFWVSAKNLPFFCLSVLLSIYLSFYMCECAPSACLVPMEVRSVCCSLGTGVLGSRGYQTQVLLDTGQCWSILFWTYILFKNLFWEAIPFQHAMQLLINPTAGHAWFLCVLTQKHGFLPFCFSPTGNRICLCRSACPQTQRLFCLSPAVFFQF